MTHELENSLRTRDLNAIKVALIGYLDTENKDDILPDLDKIESQLKSQGITLFDADDGQNDLSLGSSSKNELRSIRAALRMNFSKEKLLHGAKIKEQLLRTQVTKSLNSGTRPQSTSGYSDSVSCTKGVCIDPPPLSCNFSSSKRTTATTTEGTTISHGEDCSLSQTNSLSCRPTSFDDFSSKTETKLPEDLRHALEHGSVPAVKTILMGFLDIFDKTEPLPVIEYAAICKESLDKKGITLFDADDKSLDFATLQLSAGTLRTLKAKLRLNFSLEKMIFAEKIFQQELAEKIKNSKPQQPVAGQVETVKQQQPVAGQEETIKQQQPVAGQAETIKQQQPVAGQAETIKQQQPVAGQEETIKQQQPVAGQAETIKPKQLVAETAGSDRQQQVKSSQTTTDSRHSTTRTQTTISSQDSSGSKQNTRKPETIRVEIVYEPGPLEHFFGEIGKFFDGIFNNQGRKVERPYHKR